MGTPAIPQDFKELLRLLTENDVRYLIVGGYAVARHGYVRATADIDIWVAPTSSNAIGIVRALKQFGFDVPELSPELFQQPDKIIRMGLPPFRVEILTTISGVEFEECHMNRVFEEIDGMAVSFISLNDLKTNKKASGRLKDLADLEHLP